jgi:hypothetical protein
MRKTYAYKLSGNELEITLHTTNCRALRGEWAIKSNHMVYVTIGNITT